MVFDLENLGTEKGNGLVELTKCRVIELKRDDPESVALILPFIDRCIEFCEKYRADTHPDTLRNTLFTAFHTRSEAWKLMAAIDESGKIVAHCFADIEQYGNLGNVVFITQIEKEVQDPSIMASGFRIIMKWAAKYKIRHIMTMALDEANARRNEKDFGFKTYRWLQKLDCET